MNSSPSTALSKVYEPALVESRLYATWSEAGYFQPAPSTNPAFTVVLPPPNVTGRLHMGHALTATIEDCLVRWHRMRGAPALWLPGSDHAGIATQVMVERKLAAEGSSREAVGREKFLEHVWQWKDDHGGIIDDQHRQLGASLDWSRYRFTMDERSSKAVREAFCQLHEQGLIYRDFRLINWDYVSQTALSDLEVEHREHAGRLWEIAYPVKDSDRELVVATTRPETMLGDSGIAVHPDDERYEDLIGREVVLPLTGRSIPIVADAILVDMEFGTGAVKVTPAHDFNDFETGKRHDLELIAVIDQAGKICAPAPERFVGQSVADARKAVLAELDQQGYLRSEKPHAMSMGYSQRTGVVVEPLPSYQWFVKVAPLAETALQAVRSGETKIIPESRTADYYRWMENIHDWCISRQLWWGHQIPAWHCRDCQQITVQRTDPSVCSGCQSSNIARDPDVLDTWFSSGLWPLTTLGWPEKTEDFERHYPTSLLETGWDILFFWVARMMMFGTHFTGKAPFSTIYLHSMVLGEDGEKMSKTKGNVIDPLEMTAEYGTDALRFYLCTMAGQDSGIVFSRARVEGYRNFCNKLWNSARFIQLKLADNPELGQSERIQSFASNLSERLAVTSPVYAWILQSCARTVTTVRAQLEQYRLDLAAHTIYQFVWHEFCDWYIEFAKTDLRHDAAADTRAFAMDVTLAVYDVILRTLHPIMPFISEEIWRALPRAADEATSLMMAEHPTHARTDKSSVRLAWLRNLPDFDPVRVNAIDLALSAISSARMLKAESKVPPTQRVEVIFRVADTKLASALEAAVAQIQAVGRMSTLKILAADAEIPRESATEIVGDIEVVLPLAGLVDLGEEKARLEKSVAAKGKELAALEKKLGNAKFVERAPEEVVAKERDRLGPLQSSLAKQKALLERLR